MAKVIHQQSALKPQCGLRCRFHSYYKRGACITPAAFVPFHLPIVSPINATRLNDFRITLSDIRAAIVYLSRQRKITPPSSPASSLQRVQIPEAVLPDCYRP